MSQLDELVNDVFSKPPQKAKSIQLQLDDDSDDADAGTLQMLMSAITGKGAEKLYNATSCRDLTEKQYHTLQEYLRSMGFEMRVRCTATGLDPWKTDKYVENVKIDYVLL